MDDTIPGFQHSSFPPEDSVSAISCSESNIPSWDSLLKEAASSAQVYLNDSEESLSESSVELETNYTHDNTQSFVPLNLFQDSCSLKLSTLPSHHREILENLKDKIGYQINYFSPESETDLNEVKLICKLCCKTLHIEKVEEHAFDQEHLRNFVERCNSKISATGAISKGRRKLKTSKVSEFSKNFDKCSNKKAAERNANNNSKKVVQDLTAKLKDYMNYFELHETKWSKPCFSCKMCRTSFPSKNARLHIYSSVHLRNLRKSLSVAKIEGSEARNKKIVKDLIGRFNKRLYFFQLIRDNELNELYFVCKVCTLVLVPECLESHIYASEHLKNLQENPVVLNFDSLNNHNKQVVRELKNEIQIRRIKDFTFVYRIGTEELRFYCKCCQLTLVPENVKDHVKTSEHLRAAKAIESALKSQAFEGYVMNNATVPPKTVYSTSQVRPLSETDNENLTIVGFYSLNPSNKAIVEMLEDELDAELMYFDLLQAIDTHELYFRCTLCDVTLKPSLVSDHVMCSGHLKTWELNLHFEEFLSLEESSKKILRKLFFEVGSKLNAFCLAPDMDNRSLKFTCKFCNITLCSDIVVNHLQTKKHKAQTREDDSEDCTATASKDFKNYSNSERNSHQIVEISDPPLVGLSPPSSGLQRSMPDLNFESGIEEVLREHSSKTLMSNHNHQSESSENSFVCHNCNTTINFKLTENNGLHKAIAEKFFINCCEKCAEAILLNRKNHKVSKSNALDRNRSLTTLDENDKSEAGILCDSDKELLKSLIDKIGIKMNNFDYKLTAGSNELRAKCKFCSVMMRPESLEDHVNCGSHVVYSQLSNLSGLSFEALNDRNKKIVRKLYNKIGGKINDFDVKVKVSFFCKICNAEVSAETIPDHLHSEEHLKLVRHGSQSVTAKSSQDSDDSSYEIIETISQKTNHTSTHFSVSVDPCYDALNFWPSTSAFNTPTHKTIKSITSEEVIKTSIVTDLANTAVSEKFQVDSENFNSILSAKPAEKFYHHEKLQSNLLFSPQNKSTLTAATNHQSPLASNNAFMPIAKAQNNVLTTTMLFPEVKSMVQNPLLLSDGNCRKTKIVESTTSDQITQKMHTNDLASRPASGKFQDVRKVSNTVSPKPAEKCYGRKPFQQIPLLSSSGGEFGPTVKSNEKSPTSVRPSDSNDSTNDLSTATHDTLRFHEFKPTIENPSKSEFIDKSRQCSSSDIHLTCAACLDLLQTNIEDIANHVNSENHKTKLNLPSVDSNFTNLSDYNKKIVEVFTGEINHRLNNFDILYEIPQKELCFYCKICHIVIRAEALERHVNHAHLINLTEKCGANYALNNPIHDEFERSNFSTEEPNQVSRLFLCQVCNSKVFDESVTKHLKSERHLQLSKIRGDSLKFQSFTAYKGKVIAILCCDLFIKASDFEFFFETGSTKLYLYCKPCKVLLRPESLLNHLKMCAHSNDARVSTSSRQSSENSAKCSLM